MNFKTPVRKNAPKQQTANFGPTDIMEVCFSFMGWQDYRKTQAMIQLDFFVSEIPGSSKGVGLWYYQALEQKPFPFANLCLAQDIHDF